VPSQFPPSNKARRSSSCYPPAEPQSEVDIDALLLSDSEEESLCLSLPKMPSPSESKQSTEDVKHTFTNDSFCSRRSSIHSEEETASKAKEPSRFSGAGQKGAGLVRKNEEFEFCRKMFSTFFIIDEN
jgi:hypothetical protein